MHIDKQTFEGVQTPVYVLEEELLRRNLQLIAGVAEDAGVEIILEDLSYLPGVYPCYYSQFVV